MKKIIVLLLALFTYGMLAAQALSEAEKSTLLRMYEEEKLAKEVYMVFDSLWQSQVFQNIKAAEDYHMKTVKSAVTKFGLLPELPDKKHGVFTHAAFQAMYRELVGQGRVSLEAALRAGARIEETDIADLEKAIAETTNAELKQTYSYLLAGSENHLRAFVRNLKRAGFGYQPVVLDQQRFSKIISARNANPGRWH